MTMVNQLQRMNLKALMWDVNTVLKNTHINDDSNITDKILDQDSPIMPKGGDASTSYLDIDIDNSEHCDGGLRQVKQINDENEFKDTNFEDLVMSEGPQ